MNDSWQAYTVTYLHQKEGPSAETACRPVSQPSESWPWKRPIHFLLLSFPLSYIFWKLHQRGSGLPRGGSLPWCNSAVSTVTPQPIPLLADDDGPPQWVPIIHSCFSLPTELEDSPYCPVFMSSSTGIALPVFQIAEHALLFVWTLPFTFPG